MAAYIITGNCDEACNKLKNTLEVQDAGFKANLKTMFKPARPAPKPAPVAAPPAAPARPSAGLTQTSSGASIRLTRKSDEPNMRTRLSSTLRSTSR